MGAVTGLVAATSVAAAPRPAPCPALRLEDRVAGISQRGEISLASGRVVLLSGVRLAEGALDAPRALALLAAAVDRPVTGTITAGDPDRWGRHLADLRVDAQDRDLAAELVSQGLARVDAGMTDRLCRTDLLRTEKEARAARRGLWDRPVERPLPAHDTAPLLARTGRFTLVEGRVRTAGERRRQTYLNFGRRWNEDFTVIIPAAIWAQMKAAGFDSGTIQGRRIRIRGIIQNWRGPAIEVTAPEMVEILGSRRLRP